MQSKKLPFVFYITEIQINDSIKKLKIAYIDYLSCWKKYNLLSGKRVELPLELQYQLKISGEISEHIFEITDLSITEKDFLSAGFVQDPKFSKFVKKREKVI